MSFVAICQIGRREANVGSQDTQGWLTNMFLSLSKHLFKRVHIFADLAGFNHVPAIRTESHRNIV